MTVSALDPIEPDWYLRAMAVDVAAEEAVDDRRAAMEERMARHEHPDCTVVP